MLTKAQQVRQYQQARALSKRADFPSFAKYRPDQTRDDHGRFADEGKGGGSSGGGRATAVSSSSAVVNIYNTGKRPPNGGYKSPTPPRRGTGGGRDGGGESHTPPSVGFSGEIAPGITASTNISGWKALVGAVGFAGAVALVRNPSLITQALRLARNPKALREAWAAFTGGAATTASRMRPAFMRPRPINSTKPPMGGVKPVVPPKAKSTAARPPRSQPTKRYEQLSRSQQRKYRAQMAQDLAAKEGISVAAARARVNRNMKEYMDNLNRAASTPIAGTAPTASTAVSTHGGGRTTTGQLVPQAPATNLSMVDQLKYHESANRLRDLNIRIAATESALPAAEARYQAALAANNRYFTTNPPTQLRGAEHVRVRTAFENAKFEFDSLQRDLAAARAERYSLTAQIDQLLRTNKRLTKSQQIRKYQLQRTYAKHKVTFAKAGYKPFVPNEEEVAAPALARQRAGVSRNAAAGVNMTYRRLHGPSPTERSELRGKKPKKPSGIFRTTSIGKPRTVGAGSVRFGTYKYRADQSRDAEGQFADEGKGDGSGGGGLERAKRVALIAAGLGGSVAAYRLARNVQMVRGALAAAERMHARDRARATLNTHYGERIGPKPKPARGSLALNDLIDRKLAPGLQRVPPKVRDALRGGGENPLEFNPFKFLDFFH